MSSIPASIPLHDMSPYKLRSSNGTDGSDDDDLVINLPSEDSAPLIGHQDAYQDATATRNQERVVSPNTAALTGRNYKYPSNAISNARYSPVGFLPVILYEQFKFFFNLYFLLVALSQIVPQLRIGYLSSYIVPLAFVLIVTMGKEAWDDILRRRRDKEANSEKFEVITQQSLCSSQDLKVGNLVRIQKNQRVPADMILLKSSEINGESFIRTDQLDGETDWKLRVACPLTQGLSDDDLAGISCTCSPPEKDIHTFTGYLRLLSCGDRSLALSVDNTLWANTVIASGTVIGVVIYTGTETRQAMNTARPGTKVGLLELEINRLSKILCTCVFLLSFGLVAIHGFGPNWYVSVMRFLILFSTIIPVSLRVNLDMAKSVYAYQIEHDKSIPDTVVRTSTIPEDLGRIEYMLTDKTGTLTQNDMELKKIHVGTVSYGGDSMYEVKSFVSDNTSSGLRSRREIGSRVRDVVTALAVCHSVTPSYEEDGTLTYQAASPDEIAIVDWTSQMGLTLFKRDRHSMTIVHEATHASIDYEILHTFPFNSNNKRMGIVVKEKDKSEYWFYQKGADTVMAKIVQSNDWLDEEVGNMAREGLRTLVVGRKKLSSQAYAAFKSKYEQASLSLYNRDEALEKIVGEYLEFDLELLGITGVEDRLQKDVKPSLELLRNAGIKIWMLTGDKVETARCVAVSSKMVSRGQYIHTATKIDTKNDAFETIDFLRQRPDSGLLIDGQSLSFFLRYFKEEFFAAAVKLPAVIACRCTPQQKADVVLMIKEFTRKRVLAIGDGGNDVSMIQAADVGVGIVGKEGKQASLAADFSITQFCHLTKLLVWHGRNSYKRSAKLAQFIIHRGLIISVCQTVYSVTSKFEPIALYQGWLMVGYATVYTMAPVFSMVFDKDVAENLVTLYPELYKELTLGKSLSYRTFFVWVLISLYQGVIIQGLSQLLVGVDPELFKRLVAVSFTSLLLNELIMVALEIITWNLTMVLSETLTFGSFVASFIFLSDYFDLDYTLQGGFYWRVAVITAAALIPPWFAKALRRKLRPPNYAKVQQV